MSIREIKRSSQWLTVLLLCGVVIAGGLAGNTREASADRAPLTDEERIRGSLNRLPLSFETNVGQTDSRVRFLTRGSGYTFFLTPNETVLALARLPASGAPVPEKSPASVLRMHLVGANRTPRLVGIGHTDAHSNYFIGRDPKLWRKDISNFPRIRFVEAYDRIDLEYYGNQQELEHDFIVHPGGDPDAIRLCYEGVMGVEIDPSGELLLNTRLGALRQKKPVAYQVRNGKREKVLVRYRLDERGKVGFQLAGYDANRTLVIDPVIRYSTFIGGNHDDYGFDIALDSNRNAYLTGITGSFQQDADTRPGGVPTAEGGGYPNIPAILPFPTVGPFQNDPDRLCLNFDLSNPVVTFSFDATFCFSRYDAFVTKLNSTGTGLIYSTYLGAESDDYGLALDVDASGNAYITGQTRSFFWPLVIPVQANGGGGTDAFIVKLNANGNGLIYSSYLGGSGADRGRAVSVDSQGNAHIAGTTTSTDFPVFSRVGQIQQPQNAGGTDVFVTNIDASGSAFNYSTYLGGAGDESGTIGGVVLSYLAPNAPDIINVPNNGVQGPFAVWMGSDVSLALTVDGLGNTYVTGGTTSSDFPISPTAIQPGKSVGYDAFVTKLNGDGLLVYSTYLGGDGDDAGRGIAVDQNSSAFVTGVTRSTDFPTKPPPVFAPAFQASPAGGTSDAFVAKLNSGATSLAYSTYLGGNGEDIGNGIAVSAGGQAYVVGSTNSTASTFPTRNFLQSSTSGLRDVFVTKYTANGAEFEYSTPIGGFSDDRGMAIAVDSRGEAFVTGTTQSTNYPRSLVAFASFSSANIPGNNYQPYPDADLFVTRLLSPPFAPTNLTLTDVKKTEATMAWTDNSDNEDGFEIERKLGPASSPNLFSVVGAVGTNVVTFKDTGLIDTTTYTYRVRAFNTDGGTTFYGPYSNQLTITTLPDLPAAPSNLTVTPIDTARLKLDWTDNSNNEERFKIERKLGTPASMAAFVEIAQVLAGIITFTDTGLQANTDYSYRVRAFNVGGDSAYSNVATGKTLPLAPSVAPVLQDPPTSPGPTQIDLTWTYSVSPTDASGFKIERSDDNGVTFILLRVTTTPNVLTFSDTGLQPNRTYQYRVRAYNLSGDGPYSNVVVGLTRKTPPGGASNLTALLLPPDGAQLNWTDNSTDEDGFRVERSTDNFATAPTVVGTVGANVTTLNDLALARNTTFYYRVTAFTQNGSGQSDGTTSNTASVLTFPAAPSALAGMAFDHRQIDLVWMDNNPNTPAGAVSNFKIQRSTDGGMTFPTTLNRGPVPAGGPQSFSDTGLMPSTNYTYRVIATNASGDSGPSNVITVMTLAPPPSDPSNVVVTTPAAPTGITQLDVAWTDNSNNETGFRIERATASGGPYATAGTVLMNVTTFRDSGLNPATTYFYRIIALGAVINSDPSAPGSGTTLPSPPNAPAGVIVTTPLAPVGLTQLDISWVDNSNNEAGFRVERALVSGGPFVTAGTVGANIRFFSDVGRAPDTRYFYRVIATNTGGESVPSPEAAGVTLPNAPSDLVATLTSRTTSHLAWTDNSVTETQFVIERSTNGIVFTPIATVAADVRVFDDSGLAGDTNYTYRVKAQNAGGLSSPSNTSAVATPPLDPSGLTATVISNTEIRLFWSDNSTAETGFKVERKIGAGAFTEITQLPLFAGTGVVSYSDTALAGNTLHTYRVRAFNAAGNSDYTNEAVATTLPNPPGAPTSLTAATLSQTQIRLDWTDNASNETAFRIERRTGAGAFAEIQQLGANVTTFTDSGLAPNTLYFYRVRASNAGGNSAYSNEANAQTLPVPPNGPSGVGVTPVSDTSLRVTWTDNSSDETGFEIDRQTGTSALAFVQVATVGANLTQFVDTALTANTEYVYRVRATNAGGDSANSNTATGLTFPAAPQSVQANPLGGDKVRITWTQPANGAEGFKIDRRVRDGQFQEIRRAGAAERQFDDSGLLGGVLVTYRIRAFNRSGDSPVSAESSTTTPSGLESISVNPASIRGGRNVTGTVRLSQPAPSGGAVVSLSDNSAKANTPASVTVPAGQTTANFNIKTKRVNADTTVTITGQFGGITKQTSLTLTRR